MWIRIKNQQDDKIFFLIYDGKRPPLQTLINCRTFITAAVVMKQNSAWWHTEICLYNSQLMTIRLEILQ